MASTTFAYETSTSVFVLICSAIRQAVRNTGSLTYLDYYAFITIVLKQGWIELSELLVPSSKRFVVVSLPVEAPCYNTFLRYLLWTVKQQY